MFQIALIRGINVGRAKRVRMADLRAIVESQGCTEVRTLLNSGNVVFAAPRADTRGTGPRIERSMAARLGISARVTVLSAVELAAVVADNPLTAIASDPSRLLVAILSNPADRARLVPLTRLEWSPEAIALGKRVAYLWCPRGIIAGKLAAAVNRVLGDATTARNWTTITKLHALAAQETAKTGGLKFSKV